MTADTAGKRILIVEDARALRQASEIALPTGLDVLRTLRAEDWGRSIPVIVVSNSLLQRVFEEVRALGAEYIVKADVSLKEICSRVAATLARHAATQPG